MILTQQERGLLGAKKNREIAIQRYYENPNYCKECGKVIEVKEQHTVKQTRKKKFCNQSCAASYNNRKYPKREPVTSGPCEECGTEVHYTKQENRNYYQKKKYCDACREIVRGRKNSKKRGSAIVERTIDELKADMKSYWSWRVAITRHARQTYIRAGKPQKCLVCGYDKHFDVCHRKDVSTYSGDTKVSEINDLKNLVALCKNHHWEFDKDLLELPEITIWDANSNGLSNALLRRKFWDRTPGIPP